MVVGIGRMRTGEGNSVLFISVINALSVTNRVILPRIAGTGTGRAMTGMETGIMDGAEDTPGLIVVVRAGREVMTGIAIESIEEGTTGRGITDDLRDGHLAGLQGGIRGVTGERDIDRICCMMIRSFKLI